MTASAIRMAAEEYHPDDGRINSSRLKVLGKDGASAYHARFVEKSIPEPKSKRIWVVGTICHTLAFEPHLAADEYAVQPNWIPVRRGQVFEAWAVDQGGKTVVSSDEWRTASWMAASLRRDHAEVIDTQGESELTVYWEERGLAQKARIDKLFIRETPVIVDLKTTANVDDFARTYEYLWYWLQEAHYSAAVEAWTGSRPSFAFLAVERANPVRGRMPRTRIFLSRPEKAAWAREYREHLLDRLRSFRESNTWPSGQIVMNRSANEATESEFPSDAAPEAAIPY